MDIDTYFNNIKRSRQLDLDGLRTTFIEHLERQNGQITVRLRRAATKNFDIMKSEVEAKHAIAFSVFQEATKERGLPYGKRVVIEREAKYVLEKALRSHQRVLYDYMMEFMK